MRKFAALATPVLLFSLHAAAQNATAPLSLTQKTEVPGTSLTPGSYTIRIADHLNDRLIVQIQRPGGAKIATVLAYPNSSLGAGASGPVLFGSGLKKKPTMRGFAFQGGPAVEFVYPKTDAVALAKVNNVPVVAVDPASEGRPKLPQLTQTDMDEVTLWMLTPTTVQPGNQPGIQAARYQPAPSTSTQPVTQVASAGTPPPVPQSSVQPSYPAQASTDSGASAPAPVQASPVRTHIRPAVKQLPHTASSLPTLALLGLLSLGLAGGLGAARCLEGR